MARRGEYRLMLSADGRVLRQEVKKSEQDLKGFEKSVKDVSAELHRLGTGVQQDLAGKLGKMGGVLSSIGPAGLAAAAGIGAVAAAAGAIGAVLLDATKQAVAYGGNIADMAAKNQMGVETFQALSQGMALTGLTMQQLQKATTEMQKELVKSPETFRKLGLEAERLRAMDPADAFLRTAQAVASIQDPALRTASAFEVFGRSGAAVAAATAQLGDAADRAKALGNVMSAEMITGLDRTGDAAQTLQTTWEHLWLNIGGAIATAPGVAESIDAITDAIGGISRMIQENEPAIQSLVKDVFPLVAGAAVLVANGIMTLIGALDQLRQAWDMNVPDWVKTVAHGTMGGGIVDFLKGASGVGGGKVDPNVRNTAPAGPPLIGPGVGRSRARTSSRGRTGTARQDTESIRAMAEAMKAAKRDTDAFWSDQEKKASEFGANVLRGVLDAQAGTQQAMDEFDAVAQDVADAYVEADLRAQEAFQSMLVGVRDVAFGFQDLGDIIGGTLGKVLGFAGQTIGAMGSIAQNIKQMKTAGGGFTGLLGKVGAGLGIAGAAFSIGKSIFGGIKSLFGKKKKEETPVKTLAEQFDEVRKSSEKAGIVGSKALRDIIAQSRAAGQKIPEVEAFVKEQLGRATGAMGGITGTLKDGKVSGGINIASPESAKAQAVIFTSTFWAAVKEQGLVAAVDALSAPFEALKEKLSAGGFDVEGLLGGVGGLFSALGEGPARAALEGADALKAALEGVANAGFLTKDSFSAFQTSAQDAFNQAVAGGLATPQALQAIAPLLNSIISASKEYGFVLDDNTKSLIEQAQQAGAAFPADPILQMRDAVRELVNEIRTLNGLPTRDWGDMAGAIGAPAGPPVSGSTISAASGLRPTRFGQDTTLRAHRGEIGMIMPAAEAARFSGSGIGSVTGAAFGGGASTTAGVVTISPIINMQIDPLGVDRTQDKLLGRISEELAAAIRAGTSPVLRALQDRGKV